MIRPTALSAWLLVVAIASAGCSTNDAQPNDGGGPDVRYAGCQTHPTASTTCFEDCTWTEVLNHDSYCEPCFARSAYHSAVGDCGGYHVLWKRGPDAGTFYYYDLSTGALVASGGYGGLCPNFPLADGCSISDLKPLASWCDRYAIDGSGTACCYPDSPPPWNAACTTSLDVPPGRCGDYHLTIVGNETSYFDAASGDLAAVTWSGEDGSVCLSGPAGGFTAPTCTPALDPVCPTGATTN